jgi:hypothetical protein
MKRLDLLGVLFWVLGALYVAGALLFAVVGTLGGLGILEPSDALQERVGGAVGAAVIALGLCALGGAHAVAGTGLRGRRPWARTAGLVLGVLDILCCCNAPLGTALGIFALVVLLSDEVVRLFPGPG